MCCMGTMGISTSLKVMFIDNSIFITHKILSRQNISSILLENRKLAATTNELKIKSGGHQISRPT